MANIVATYLCWFFGGIFGLHHVYLGRDKHAFVWWISLGGLGLGWFRDLWRIPEYLHEQNRDERFLAEFASRRQRFEKPPFSFVRFAGQLLIGCILAYLFRLAIPEMFLKDSLLGGVYMVVLPVMGATVGVKMVANIGNQKVAMKWCLLGASIGIPWLLQEEQSIITAPLFSAVLASKKAEWDPDKTYPKGVCNFIKRILVLTLCGMLYLSLWTSVIYFNAHVTTKDGTQVPIHVAVDNFFQSPAWKEMKKTMSDLYECCQYNGWGHCYQKLIEHLDPTGESHAYKVLEFKTDNPSAEEIQQQCRRMARKWHPDKYRSEEEKAAAQDKFIEVQKACDILNDMRKKRTENNMKSDTTTKVPPHEHPDL